MAVLFTAIHVFAARKEGVDGRDEHGHDVGSRAPIEPHRIVDQERLLQRRRRRDPGNGVDQQPVVGGFLLHVGAAIDPPDDAVRGSSTRLRANGNTSS